MRIGILALLHESNTFISQPTTIRHFEDGLLATGDEVRERLADTHHEVGGFFDGLEQAQAAGTNIETVPIFAGRAVPYGTIDAGTMRELMKRMMDAVESSGQLDGVLVAPHGATVSEDIHDVDGHWLSTIRRFVGETIPIIGTMDPHTNLSPLMVDSTNALIAYRTNPHLDQRQRGLDAARMLVRTLQGEINPTQAAAFPRMAINIERQLTSEPQCRPLYELADRQLELAGVLSNSILLGFPYADVAEMGSAAVAVTDGDSSLAQTLVDELGTYLWEHRKEFDAQLISVDSAVRQAQSLAGPVCLLDMGDNVGGGSPADSTILAHALQKAGLSKSFVCLYDPEVVKQAVEAGPGSEIECLIGAKTDSLHGHPLKLRARVSGIYDGKFFEPQPRHGGFTHCDQGQTVVLESEAMTVLVNTKRMPPFSLQQLVSCNVDPSGFQVLVAKGVNAPVAAYREVCQHLIRVNTPGVTTADMRQLTYHNRRQPMFPFE